MGGSFPSRETRLGGWGERPVELRCPRHLHGKLTSRWIEVKCKQCGELHWFDRLTGQMRNDAEGEQEAQAGPEAEADKRQSA